MRLLLLFLFFTSSIANASFFDERYRGWFWFEKKEKKQKKISPNDAEVIISDLKNELDGRRNIMIAEPNVENVINYIIWEEKMWKKALMLDDAYREAKFKYPEYFIGPNNVHTVKLSREIKNKESKIKISKFAEKYDLVLFSKDNCQYSKALVPIVKNFADQYKFNVEEVSLNGSISGKFKGREYKPLGKKLKINATPVIYAISKDKKQAFEMIRGLVSKSELEEYAILAYNYSGI